MIKEAIGDGLKRHRALVVTHLEPNLVPKWPYLVPTFYFVQSLCTAASIKVNIKVYRSHTFRPDI